jgi:hypothetical protein
MLCVNSHHYQCSDNAVRPHALSSQRQRLTGSCERLDPVLYVEFAEDLIHGPFDGADRHRELIGNFLIGQAPIDQAQDFELDFPQRLQQWTCRRQLASGRSRRQQTTNKRGVTCLACFSVAPRSAPSSRNTGSPALIIANTCNFEERFVTDLAATRPRKGKSPSHTTGALDKAQDATSQDQCAPRILTAPLPDVATAGHEGRLYANLPLSEECDHFSVVLVTGWTASSLPPRPS